MAHSVAHLEKRRRRWKIEGRRTLAAAFTVIGLGWLVVVPAVAGFIVGHWLDARYGSGISLSAGLGFLGLALGCWSAWRRIARQHDQDREDRG